MSLILENIKGYSSIELKAKQVVEGFLSGLHSSPFHGYSVEFADYRAYNQGESTKNIDWKLFARTDKLFIKNYNQETNLRCMLVMDSSASMGFPFDNKHNTFENPNKLIYSTYAAACILQMLYKQRDAFGLTLFSDKVDMISSVKSTYQHKRYIYTLLEQLIRKDYKQLKNSSNIAPILHYIAENVHKRSLVIIFSDLLSMQEDNEQIINALQHLRFNKHEVILFHIYDKNLEENLQYKNRPYKFVDVETMQEVKLNPSDIKETYKELMQQNFKYLHHALNNMQIDYVPVDINLSYNKVLLPYFFKRLRMR